MKIIGQSLHFGVALLEAMIIFASPTFAQAPRLVENRNYYDPFAAEIRAGKTDILGLAYGKGVPFQRRTGNQFLWDIGVGTELPIVVWESSNSGISGLGSYPAGHFGLGFWIPVDFHLLLALQDSSSPPLDTDYRFGALFKARYTICSDCLGGFANDNMGIALRIAPFIHESTHLGDEYTIAALRRYPATFERINVSSNSFDVAVALAARGHRGHSRIAVGLNRLLPGQSYYQSDLLETGGRAVTPPHNRSDFYLDAEWRRSAGGPYWSVETRWRSVFDYHRTSVAQPEDRELSTNLVVGWYTPRQGPTSLGKISPYVRLYHGVNPFGQFRSQRDYQLVGFGLRIEP